jgi:hypothetical protein
MKRAVALFLSIGLALGSVQPANAQDAYNPELINAPENGGVFQIGESGSSVAFSTLAAGRHQTQEEWVCDSTTDPECSTNKSDYMQGEGILPPCESDADENCVAGLQISVAGSEFESATYTRSTKGMTFPANPALDFYEQSTPSLWEAPNSPSASGATSYVVLVRATQSRENPNRKFKTWRFTASVIPYREQPGENFKSPYQETNFTDPVQGKRPRSIGIGGHGYECAWSEDGACGVAQDFAPETKVKLTIRISKNVGGWFQGRIKNPNISVKSFSATNNEISVSAEPAVVQRMVYTLDDVKNLSEKERGFVRENGFAGSWERFVTWSEASQSRTFAYLNHFKTKLDDKATGHNTFWNFASSAGAGQGSQCLSDTSKVLGIVTTNAMVYDGGVPKFSRGFLDYKVAGLHYEADGVTEVMGSYDLVMRSDVARCLYKFSKAPVSATITISGEGDKNIATTVVGEKGGWLKLAAYDFTFSQKTIKVKLTQKKTTITCVAPGKKAKKVTGFSPKCPKGFKKR